MKPFTLITLVSAVAIFTGCIGSVAKPKSLNVSNDAPILNEVQKERVLNRTLNHLASVSKNARKSGLKIINNCVVFGETKTKHNVKKTFSYSTCFDIKGANLISNSNSVCKMDRFNHVTKKTETSKIKCKNLRRQQYYTNFINKDIPKRIKAQYKKNALAILENPNSSKSKRKGSLSRDKRAALIAEAKKTKAYLFEEVEFEKIDGFGDKVKTKNCRAYMQDETGRAYLYAQTWTNPYIFNMNAQFRSSIGRVSQIATGVFGAGRSYYGRDFKMEDLALQKENIKLSGELTASAITLSLAKFIYKNTGDGYLGLEKKKTQLIQAYLAANNLIAVVGSGKEACRYWPNSSGAVLNHVVENLAKYSRDKATVRLLFILASDRHENEKIKILLNQPGVQEMFLIISEG